MTFSISRLARNSGLSLCGIFLFLSACHQPPSESANAPQSPSAKVDKARPLERIAFGSCADQDKDQPILTTATSKSPDLFIFLGDNIYGDTEDMDKLRRKYNKLGSKPEFKKLRETTPLLAVWDDHDYGENDAGRYYPKKEESKEIFLDFWAEAEDSERRQHPGIYHSTTFGPEDKRVQVIMLDTRTFRDNLILNHDKKFLNDYQPNPSPDSTFLGAAQWAWLKDQFQAPAKVRLIASSNQFSHEYNGWESWTNVPRERERMLSLIRKTRANGVIFMSGDVHWGELSVIRSDSLYPIYDVTSSGITQTWPKIDPNKNRVGAPQAKNNFGMISIDWEQEDPEISLEIYTVDGNASVSHKVRLSDLDFD